MSVLEMSFTSVYEINKIPIDEYFYAGIEHLWRSDYNELFDLNCALLKRNTNVLFGPAFNEEGSLLEVDREIERFAAGIYLTKKHIEKIPFSCRSKLEIKLREALDRLQKEMQKK